MDLNLFVDYAISMGDAASITSALVLIDNPV